jgi:hypothetical protein
VKIYCKDTGRQAQTIHGPNDSLPVYKCFLPGRPSNEDAHAHKFTRIEDAALFLISHPGSGIRVGATGQSKGEKTAILSKTIIIERDA